MVSPLPKHRAREYETIFIVHPDTAADGIEQVAGRVTDAIDRLQGKLLKAENWGKRRLAYPVSKQQQGFYVYLKYLGYSDIVHEVERNLRMMEPVIKYLTVKIDEDVNPDARPVSDGDISFVPQVEEEPEAPEDDDMGDEMDDDRDDDDMDDDDYDDDDVMERKSGRSSRADDSDSDKDADEEAE